MKKKTKKPHTLHVDDSTFSAKKNDLETLHFFFCLFSSETFKIQDPEKRRKNKKEHEIHSRKKMKEERIC